MTRMAYPVHVREELAAYFARVLLAVADGAVRRPQVPVIVRAAVVAFTAVRALKRLQLHVERPGHAKKMHAFVKN